MVIPACSRVALIWSSRILISSVISAGALPDLSRPMRPARYSVLPARIPSLNGAATGLCRRLRERAIHSKQSRGEHQEYKTCPLIQYGLVASHRFLRRSGAFWRYRRDRARVYSALGQDASERIKGKRRSPALEIFPKFLCAERHPKLRRQFL